MDLVQPSKDSYGRDASKREAELSYNCNFRAPARRSAYVRDELVGPYE
jgi:hypothetical protein